MKKNNFFKNLKVKYFKLESFGAVDGPGVRMIVFTQGCKYRCLYCHNPESWNLNSKQEISIEEILNKFESNQTFYRNGGITLSGGEPLMHKDFCYELAKACFFKKISLAFDTSGLTFDKQNLGWFKKIIKFKPLWIVDVKSIDESMHKVLTGFSELNEIKLIKFLEKNKQHYWLRQVLLPNYTDNKKHLLKLRNFLNNLKYMDKFELLPYHELMLDKYKSLNIVYPLTNKTHVPSKQEMIEIQKLLY